MPHRCILGCKNTNVIMHVFPNPARFPERFKAWVDLVNERLETPMDVDYFRKKRICEIHFIQEHKNRYKRLSAIAMPMLNLPGIPMSKTQNSDDSQPSSPFAASDVMDVQDENRCGDMQTNTLNIEATVISPDVMDPQDSENRCGDMQTSTSNIEAAVISLDVMDPQDSENRCGDKQTSTSNIEAAVISLEATVIKEHNYSVLSRPPQTSFIKGSRLAATHRNITAWVGPPARWTDDLRNTLSVAMGKNERKKTLRCRAVGVASLGLKVGQQSTYPLTRNLMFGSKMAPILYKLDASPPACAVRIVADIIGLQLDFKDPDISKMEHKSPGYMQLNPLGTIPVLVDGDYVLSDSHAIMIYLLSKYGGDTAESLYPSDIRTRGIVNQVMFFDTGILFIRIKVVALPTIMEGMKAPTEKHLHDLEEAYGMIEAYLSRNEYIAADHLTIADLSIATTLAAAEAILSLNKVKFPLTAKWQEMMQELPSFKKIATPGIAKFNVAMQYHWKKNNKQ